MNKEIINKQTEQKSDSDGENENRFDPSFLNQWKDLFLRVVATGKPHVGEIDVKRVTPNSK